MKIIRHTTVVVEKLVVLMQWDDSDWNRLLNPDHPEHEGWTLDWYKGNKFVLTRERDYTVIVGSQKRQ